MPLVLMYWIALGVMAFVVGSCVVDTVCWRPRPPQPSPASAIAYLEAQIPKVTVTGTLTRWQTIPELVAQAERQTLAEVYPLDGDPREAKVADVRQVRRLPQVAPLAGAGPSPLPPDPPAGSTGIDSTGRTARVYLWDAPGTVEVTAFGDPVRRWVSATPAASKEAALRRDILDQRDGVVKKMQALANSAPGRMFTADERRKWGNYREALSILDSVLHDLGQRP